MLVKSLLAAAVAVASVAAETAPQIDGFTKIEEYAFNGFAGTLIDETRWNVITGPNPANSEAQIYQRSTDNLIYSNTQTLKIIPRKTASGGWTSARIESKRTFTPPDGHKTRLQAKIRFGDNALANKQGIWPAFWLLGDSIRHGTAWPQCGEIDILETVNGQMTGYGTVHCDVSPGGICNEGSGLGGNIGFGDNAWHEWRVTIDRTSAAWTAETITWFRDDQQYWQVTGARINNEAVWNTLVNSPLYFILNVAVGGNWPGQPNASTLGGDGSAMEVAYVAQYQSN
ncbi:putative endo-1,3(4)-beta-glucanase [Xylariaceae sp. FL1019]|nr:putative endo-1,3(4)-beta-glucanase [Xylariaceae sp. FL1019]